MDVLTLAILLFVALVACAFAVWPIIRRRADRGRYVLAAAVVALILGVGGGSYLILGAPQLALRSLEGDDARDLNAMIGKLATVVRERPNDPQGWGLLGRAYLTANDPADAAKAFARSIAASRAGGGQLPSFILSAYGEALTQSSGGAVTPEAEAAFTAALAADPKDKAARYYLGLAHVARGDTAGALALWKSLLADEPASSSVHQDIVNRMADLTARGGGAMPDIDAMVAGLAARLKSQPDDPAGWQRLIRSYAVLGDKDKARAALADARKALATHSDARAMLDAEAKQLGL
ncbi:MAG TPA: tetratricopeptide repeat protein [Bradyrhizobium sp.]